MENPKYDHFIKLIMVGGPDEGKQRFLHRFIDEPFISDELQKLGIVYKVKFFNVNNKLIKLEIWDTAKQDRFRALSKSFFKGIHGAILIYDVTNEATFNHIQDVLKLIDQNENHLPKVLVGNECDKDNRKVSEEKGRALAEEYKMPFFETSTEIDQNIIEIFTTLVEEILKVTPTPQSNELKIDEKKKQGKNKKCYS